MGIDLEAVRRAYRDSPPPGFSGVPSLEERIAESERTLVRRCIEAGRDPKAEGLGVHGSLIGGPGKPTRIYFGSAPFENICEPVLAPTSWFPCDVRSGGSRSGGQRDKTHLRLRFAIASHLAGTPREYRPSGEQLRKALLSEAPGPMERFWIRSILACADIRELRAILRDEALPIRVLVRAAHASGGITHRLCDWLNRFSVRPVEESARERCEPDT